MKEYFKLDENGNILGIELFNNDKKVTDEYKLGWGQEISFFKPKFDFTEGKWIEGATEEEINIIKNTIIEKTEMKKLQEEVTLTQEAINFLLMSNI